MARKRLSSENKQIMRAMFYHYKDVECLPVHDAIYRAIKAGRHDCVGKEYGVKYIHLSRGQLKSVFGVHADEI